MNQTEERKREHIKISLKENVSAHHNYWDDVTLIHNALPEINEDEIDLSIELFGKKLGAPLIISAMTGGYSEGKKINENLAAAAEKFHIAMGVGSQRAALENSGLKDTYSIINNYNIPLKIANIGASQIVLWDQKKILENAEKIVEMIDADILAICLNFLQEVIQPEGEAHAKGCLETIDMLSREFGRPILIKESGAGISYKVAESLKKTNIAIIATGGIRNGLDVARGLVLGAHAAGIAHTLLKPATQDKQSTIFELDVIIKELRTAMFLVGADNVEKLSDTEVEYGLEN